MIIFPAIDIKEGKVVRLVQGQFDRVTEYSQDPVKVAEHWKAQGAQWLHVVDLDGARTGQMTNAVIIKKIASTVGIPIQVGGGVRSLEIIKDLFENNVARVILGTKAFEDQEFLKTALKTWPENIVVSLDCSNEYVMKNGWVVASDVLVWDFIEILKKFGLKYLVYTDVSRDGMLSGPNSFMLRQILASVEGIKLIASGGVSSIEDIKNLCRINKEFNGRLFGVITGKAIYEGKLNLKEAISLCSLSE
jgi:phosphoribosylformimino-5-aminoimidazole carboxamide ribotide isomerase